MRKREKVDESWEVRYPERVGGSAMRLWSRHDSSTEAHSAARRARADLGASVRVSRVTRYRLAPLVEIAAWRHCGGWAKCGARAFTEDGPWGIVDSHGGGRWMWTACERGVRIDGHARTKRAAIAAAEAALAVLGYRVAK